MNKRDLGEKFTVTPELEKAWQKVLARFSEANFLQSPEYGKMNAILGCKIIVEDFGGKGWALMIVRDAKRGRYLEIPCGPLCDWSDTKAVKAIFEKITAVGKREKCVFVRVRPQLLATDENLALLGSLGLKKSPMHLAAEHTVMIDLTKSEEELLAGMRRQTRYEVRRADKLGLKVTRGETEADFREFHAVQTETARRQDFVPPSLEVLMAEREAFSGNIWVYKVVTSGEEVDDANTKVSSETHNDGAETNASPEASQPVAYGLIVRGGREGDYYEAASTDLNRKLPGAYALLWQAMQDLKAAGCERFNLWGIAPAGQPNHRYAGVTTFKTGFSDDVVEFVPAHDLILSRMGYLKDYVVEAARKKRRHL